MSQRLSRKIFYLFRLIIAIAMLWYLASMGSIDWTSFSGLLNKWQYTLVSIGLFGLATVLQALRMLVLINAHDLKMSITAAIRLTFIGLFFNTYLPGATGGDLVKIYYASKGNPGRRTEVITILVLDRIVGLFSLLTLPLLLAPFFADLISNQATLKTLLGISLAVATTVMLVALVGFKFNPSNSRLLQRIQKRFRIGQFLARILSTLHNYRNRLNVLSRALLCSYCAQILMVIGGLAIVQATNPAGADLKMIVLIPMGYVANSIPITPGGLGVGEAAMEALFTMNGLSGGAETILGWRVVMIILGMVGLAFYLKGETRFISHSGDSDATRAEKTRSIT